MHRTYVPLRRLLSNDGTTELVRLDHLRHSEGWNYYAVTFGGLAEQEWVRVVNDTDPRDVTYVFERADGVRTRFAIGFLTWDLATRELRVKWEGAYEPTPPRRSVVDWLLRRPKVSVPPERAPFVWHATTRRSIVRKMRDEPDDVLDAVSDLRSVRPKDAPWALQQLERFIEHPDPHVRLTAAGAAGELARRHGVTSDRAKALLERMKAHPAGRVEGRVAEESLDEISRFATR